MFLSPQDRISLAQSERNAQFQRDMQAAQERAKASPVASGLFNTAVTLAGGALGGFMTGKGLGTALGASGAQAAAGAGAGGGFMGVPFLTPTQGASAYTPLPYDMAGPRLT